MDDHRPGVAFPSSSNAGSSSCECAPTIYSCPTRSGRAPRYGAPLGIILTITSTSYLVLCPYTPEPFAATAVSSMHRNPHVLIISVTLTLIAGLALAAL